MYALKEAMVTKERFQKDIDTVIFYMDMRTSGKDYELYLNRARDEYGVRLERTRPHTVEPVPGSDDLSITYIPAGTSLPRKEVFDMVVLSTGFVIPPDAVELEHRLGIELDGHHFAKTGSFSPVATSKPGIYVCGLSESPKDIPETMVQASAAACMAAQCLRSSEASAEEEEDLPPERDVSGEEPRIGVFICDCGTNIGGSWMCTDWWIMRPDCHRWCLSDDRPRVLPRVPGDDSAADSRKQLEPRRHRRLLPADS